MVEPYQYKDQFILIYGTNPASSNDVNTHIMYAKPNAKTSDAAWRIMFFAYDASDRQIKGEFPRRDGVATSDFAFVADDYLSYDYGPA